MWLFILISYLQFRRALAFNSIVYETLAYTAVHRFPMIKLSYITIVSIVTIIIGNGIVNIWEFSWDLFISCYLTLIILIVGSVWLSVIWKQPILKKIEDIDIFTNQSVHAFK